ncbi:sulfite exporter TauE/SafE family protein [Herbaspirillum huttiense]|uniref:sulfite exporter TauE/SafE family protein n=1 Tax=Herbaspirillum huttiense TaxID=863372 RepID=UPI000410ADED|nr:sulfite exporter TauE/SafE family protein [Herbaspirillum huttiense]
MGGLNLNLSLIPVFMVGLMGSVHCIGMCGGIIGAFSMAPASVRAKPFPVAVSVMNSKANGALLLRTLSYNLGRIGSYAVAGALAGGLAGGARLLAGMQAWQAGIHVLAQLMLVALGLYLMDAWRGLARTETVGNILWQRLRPLTDLLLPLDSPFKLVLAGGLWGWLPCGMVYSALLTALMAGSAVQGALTMLAFGAGTLPVLLVAGMSGARLRQLAARPWVRRSAGVIVLAFGLLGLLRAAEIGGLGIARGWIDVFCVSPVHGG